MNFVKIMVSFNTNEQEKLIDSFLGEILGAGCKILIGK